MAKIIPFCAVRPRTDLAGQIAALPYDVYSREEAYEAVKDDSLSFLRMLSVTPVPEEPPPEVL